MDDTLDNTVNDPTLESVRFQLTGNVDPDEVESDLSGLDGVRSVDADQNGNTVTVRFDAAIIDDNAIREALESSGYHIQNQESTAPGA